MPLARRRRHRRRSAPALLVACISAFLSLVFGTLDVSGKAVSRRRLRRRVAGRRAVGVPQSHRLGDRDPDADLPRDHRLDAVLLRPACSRRSARRPPAAARARFESFRDWREERRREQQRREVIAKHTKKGAPARTARRRRGADRPAAAASDVEAAPRPASDDEPRATAEAGRRLPRSFAPRQAAEGEPCRRRRCRCRIPSRRRRRRPSAAKASTRCRRSRCSTRRRPSARSTNAS